MTSSNPRTEIPISWSVERLRKEFDRWLDAAVVQGERALETVGLRGTDRSWIPSVDVTESAENLYVEVDLPGVDPEAVEITLVGNMLTVQGNKLRPLEQVASNATVHTQERPVGEFSRAIPLPQPVVAEDVSANYHHGVLLVTLTKAARARPQQIKVDIHGSGPSQTPAAAKTATAGDTTSGATSPGEATGSGFSE